jgi:hypothetical protein
MKCDYMVIAIKQQMSLFKMKACCFLYLLSVCLSERSVFFGP